MAFLTAAARRSTGIQATATATSIDAPAMAPEPMTRLRALASELRRRATGQRALAAPDALAKVTREIAELDNRLRLGERRKPVLARIEALRQLAHLRKASTALGTTGLSKKIGDFTESAVTAQLRARLDMELGALRCAHLPVAIGARGMKGKTRVSLQLDATRNVDVCDVLSEVSAGPSPSPFFWQKWASPSMAAASFLMTRFLRSITRGARTWRNGSSKNPRVGK